MGVTMTMAVAMDVVMDVTMVNLVEWLQNGVNSMEEWRGLYANCILCEKSGPDGRCPEIPLQAL